jgi:hypothetical protein
MVVVSTANVARAAMLWACAAHDHHRGLPPSLVTLEVRGLLCWSCPSSPGASGIIFKHLGALAVS